MAPKKSKDGKKTAKDEVKDEEELVLTPSEKELGMKVMIIKKENKNTMKRLYSVPSEKLRVWTCWLNKVGDRAEDWQWWLRAQIRLTVRISDLLQKANLALEEEKNEKFDGGDDPAEPEVATESEGAEKLDVATEPQENETETTDPTEINEPESTPPAQEVLPQEENVPREFENAEAPEGESHDRTMEPEDRGDSKGGEEIGDKNGGKEKKETETKTKRRKEVEPDPKIEYKEGFWPVGVRWKPVSQRAKHRPPSQRLPDEIPVPGNEEDMMDLVRKIRHQGVVYRSLYKHWSDTAEQAVKEIVGRPILRTSQIFPNGEDVPYFFYLGSSEDMEYVIEHEVLTRDPERERITQDFRHLYFNLSDKPGKGGKPWI